MNVLKKWLMQLPEMAYWLGVIALGISAVSLVIAVFLCIIGNWFMVVTFDQTVFSFWETWRAIAICGVILTITPEINLRPKKPLSRP